jgi:branched-chain amino acid transport system permease protein
VWNVIILGLLAGGVLALVAMGLTLIFGVMDVVNFAHGEFVMLGMIATATLTTALGISPYVAAPLVVLASIPVALVIFQLVIKPSLGRSLYVQVFATLGLSIVLQAVALMVFGPATVAVSDAFSAQRVNVLGVSVELGRLIAFVVALLLFFAVWLLLEKSRLGQEIRAVAQDHGAARIVGIRVGRVHLTVFVTGIALTVAAGSMIVPFQAVTPVSGLSFALISFVVVVLGGFGSLMGALIGGLSVGVIETAAGYYLGTQWSQGVLFLIFVIILLVRPSGLMGRPTGDAQFAGAR